MSLAIRLVPEICRVVGFAAINDVYIGIGTAMTKPIRFLMLQSDSDIDYWISMDGINNHFPLMAYGHFVWDITSNKTIEQGFYIGQGTRFYVKALNLGEVATEGGIYLSTFYGAE